VRKLGGDIASTQLQSSVKYFPRRFCKRTRLSYKLELSRSNGLESPQNRENCSLSAVSAFKDLGGVHSKAELCLLVTRRQRGHRRGANLIVVHRVGALDHMPQGGRCERDGNERS
jgi:hypothetical protein